jgi:polysaccharide deacetylase 2 family uncharacterized protein YibQ
MIKDPKTKERIKQYLIGANIFLGAVLFLLIFFWLLFVRPEQIRTATAIGHYTFFYMDNLPAPLSGKIEADYIGDKARVAASADHKQENEEKKEHIEPAMPLIVDNDDTVEPEELLDRAEAILQKTNSILSDKQEAPQPLSAVENKRSKGTPKISIIVTNLGLNRRSTELALTLPKQFGLGFLPYTKSLTSLLNKAQNNGHEIYLYLPLQTSKSLDNPGRYALMTNLPPEENAVRLSVVLNSHAKYNGIYSNFKEVFTSDKQSCKGILDHLNDRNLIFILGKTSEKGLPEHIKSCKNIIPTNIIIDIDPDKEAIEKELEKLVKVASKEGLALGYAQGLILTIEMLRDWAPSLEKRGIKLVPVSELLKEYNL